MKLINRKSYLDKLINVIGTPDIKVITGVRRSGKSKLLEALKAYLTENIPNANIIHINFNLPEYEEFTEYKPLYDYINGHYKDGCENIVMIDEIQMCNNFEKAINGLHASEKFDIYITGSNAFLLSSDLATLFTGRTFEIKVFPFSFSEFQQYFGYENNYDAFDRYVLEGGMSGSYLYKDIEAKYSYIDEVYHTLIVRDIRTKYHIRNVFLMDRISDFLMDNISNLTSARSLTDTFNGNKDKINHKTVGSYLQYLCNAFAFYKVRRYDTLRARNIFPQMRNTTFATIPSDMQSLERKIWTMEECTKISLPLSLCVGDMRFMLVRFIRKRSILLPSSVMKSFISKYPTIFPMKRHLNGRSLHCLLFGTPTPKFSLREHVMTAINMKALG